MWNGIQMLLKFDVVVDIDPGGLANGIFIRFFGDGSQIRLVDVFKLLPPRTAHRQHDLMVKPVQLFPDGPIHLCQAKKGAVSQRCNDPALDILNPIFTACLYLLAF